MLSSLTFMRGTCTLSRPEWPSVCSADQSYSPKMRMVLSKLSRSDEQALNIESKGSDRLELRTRLDCPLRLHWQIRTAPNQLFEGIGPSARQMAQAVLKAYVESNSRWASQCLLARPGFGSSVQGSTKLRAPLRSPRCRHAPVASDALSV